MAALPGIQPNDFTPSILPIITLIGGFLGNYYLERKREKIQYEREIKAKEQERKQSINDKQTAFQRNTLIMLQQELLHMRHLGHELYVYNRVNGWGSLDPVNSKLGQENIKAVYTLSVNQVRVLDDKLQEYLSELTQYAVTLQFAETQEKGGTAEHLLSAYYDLANDRIGELLQELY